MKPQTRKIGTKVYLEALRKPKKNKSLEHKGEGHVVEGEESADLLSNEERGGKSRGPTDARDEERSAMNRNLREA